MLAQQITCNTQYGPQQSTAAHLGFQGVSVNFLRTSELSRSWSRAEDPEWSGSDRARQSMIMQFRNILCIDHYRQSCVLRI